MVQTLMRQPDRRAGTKAQRRKGWKRVVTGGGRIGPNGTRKVVRKGLGGAPQRAAAPRMHQGRKTGPEGGFAARIGELPALQVVKHPKSICIAHFCVKTTGLAVVLFAGARGLVPRRQCQGGANGASVGLRLDGAKGRIAHGAGFCFYFYSL